MSIEPNSPIRIKKFFSERRRSERTQALHMVENRVINGVIKNLDFVMLWGGSNKVHCSKSDVKCITYLFKFLNEVEKKFEICTHLKVIFADTHAYLNGYQDANYYNYFKEVGQLLKTHNCKFEMSSSLCQNKIQERGYANYKDFIDSIISSPLLFDSINLSISNQSEINVFYKYALRHCNRIGDHESGIFFENKEQAAKAYLYFVFFEKNIIAHYFKEYLFLTYLSREESFALPDLPVVRIFSLKSGSRTRPWFTEE